MSAATGEGLDDLLRRIESMLPVPGVHVSALLPYDAGSLLSRVREYGNVDSVDYRADGIWIEADVDRRLAAQIVDRAIDETDGDGSDHIDAFGAIMTTAISANVIMCRYSKCVVKMNPAKHGALC